MSYSIYRCDDEMKGSGFKSYNSRGTDAPIYTDGFGRELPIVTREANHAWAVAVEKKREGAPPDAVLLPGDVFSNAMILASTTIGAGIMGMPSAFHSSGIVMGSLYCAFFGALTVYSYTLLGVAGMRTGLRNYEQIAEQLLGRRAGMFTAVCLLVYCLGVLTSYVTSVSDIFAVCFADVNPNLAYLGTVPGRRFVTSMIWMTFMVPLCLPQHLSSLRFFSLLAVCLMIIFVFIMVVHSARANTWYTDDLVYFGTGNAAIAGMSTFTFSYISQINAYCVFEELYKPSVRRLTVSSAISTSFAFTLYLLAGVFGYLEFGSLVDSVSALRLYKPMEDVEIGIGYIFVLFKLCVGYGLHMIGVREALYYMINFDMKKASPQKNASIMIFVALLSLMAGLFVPSVGAVIDVSGGVFGGFVAYVFPALMAMYGGAFTPGDVGWRHFCGTYLLLLVGVIVVVFGTCSAIYARVE